MKEPANQNNSPNPTTKTEFDMLDYENLLADINMVLDAQYDPEDDEL